MALDNEDKQKLDLACTKVTQVAEQTEEILHTIKNNSGRGEDIAAGIAEHHAVKGDATTFGHTKILDSTSNGEAASTGISVSPKGVNSAITEAIDNNAVKLEGAQTVAGAKTFTSPVTVAAPTNTGDSSLQAAPISWVKNELRASVEKMSNGKRTVLMDSAGDPHFMIRIPKFNLQDISSSLGTGVHPMFIIKGKTYNEILVGQYLASKGTGNMPKTLPGKDPWASIRYGDVPAAARALKEKGGDAFAANTSVNFAGRALFLLKHFGDSHVYHGNTAYGCFTSNREETGTMSVEGNTPGDTGNPSNSRTLTGSGPVEWYDDGTENGLADLVGNVWEVTPGLRLNEGEINVIQDNDAMDSSTDLSASSGEWKGILQNGNLVAAGTANTLKFEAPKVATTGNVGTPKISTTVVNLLSGDAHSSCYFKDLAAATGVTVPALLEILGIFPFSTGVQGYLWTRNFGERLAIRGGDWYCGLYCGPFALSLHDLRSHSSASVGFRLAFAA